MNWTLRGRGAAIANAALAYLAAGVVVLGIAIAVAPIGDAVTAPELAAVSGSLSQTDPEGEAADSPSFRTELTSSERIEALVILTADPLVAARINGVKWQVANAGLLTTADPNQVIGAAVEIEWETPVAIDVKWPTMGAPVEVSASPYTVQVMHITAKEVRGIRVLIDFGADSVIEILPLEGALEETFEPVNSSAAAKTGSPE